MLELMAKVVNDYEKDFGKIVKPKAIEKMEKKLASKGDDVEKAIAPTYFG